MGLLYLFLLLFFHLFFFHQYLCYSFPCLQIFKILNNSNQLFVILLNSFVFVHLQKILISNLFIESIVNQKYLLHFYFKMLRNHIEIFGETRVAVILMEKMIEL